MYDLARYGQAQYVDHKGFAKKIGKRHTTVIDWLQAGRVKGAVFKETRLAGLPGYWLVPDAAVVECTTAR
ncbi:MAG TPA: hypothetical protein VJX67_07170 [Blastocatellia bacterium]|nr:hypothetical protein [Blastocatellia bacterium]